MEEIYLKNNKHKLVTLENDLAEVLDNANEIICEMLVAVNECKDAQHYQSALGLNLWKLSEIQSQLITMRRSFTIFPTISCYNGHNLRLVNSVNDLANRYSNVFKQMLHNHMVDSKAWEDSDMIPPYLNTMDYKETYNKYGYTYLTHIAHDSDLMAIKKRVLDYIKNNQ